MTTSIKNTNKSQPEIAVEDRGLAYSQKKDDELDLIQLFLNIGARWKQIVLITAIGTAFSFAITLILPKVYENSARISLPGNSAVTIVNSQVITNYNAKSLFKEYFNLLRSEMIFKAFLSKESYLDKLYPAQHSIHDGEIDDSALFSQVARRLQVKIEEYANVDGSISEPIGLSLAFQGADEAINVEIVNEYLNFTNSYLLTYLEEEQIKKRNVRLEILHKEVKNMRRSAKIQRELLVAERTEVNKEKLKLLEQKKQTEIYLSAQERKTRIAILEEKNEQKLNEFTQQKSLLLSKASQDRETRIAKAQEAHKIAKGLNIIHPTRLDNVEKQLGDKNEGQTRITLSDNHSLPLYLMGTNYLTILIDTLKKRENESIFLTEFAVINNKIEMVKNDQSIKSLKSRKTENSYLIKLNLINADIFKVQNDIKLKTLKEREIDDPFIAGFPELLGEIAKIEQIPLKFENVNTFTLLKAASAENVSIGPSRKLIIAIGLVLSCFLALIITVFSSAIANRQLKVY